MRKAVVDVGSNSVLLLVAERVAESWVPVLETSEVTGLGAGTKSTHLLGEQGISDTLRAVKTAYEAARGAGAQEIVAAATMAARIAGNTPDFIDRAQQQGTPITVLTGEEEADLGFRAIAGDATFAAHKRLSIIDVGGHSTEIVTAEDGQVMFRKSFPLGTLGLKDTVMSQESPDVMSRIRAVQEVDDLLGVGFRPGLAGHAVALGATGTNLVTIRERMAEWQPEKVHGAYLDYEEVGRSVGWLCAMTDKQRAELVGIERGREGTIHIGSLILERCLFALRVEGCSVSVRGWRHALIERLGASP